MSSYAGVVLLCGLGFFTVGQLRSQEKPEPPRRATTLPDDQAGTTAGEPVPPIDLPEFEITGEEVIRLDALSKSSADDSWRLRSSTLENNSNTREASLLPTGGTRNAGLLTGEGGFTGRAFAEVGSFQTPLFDLWLGVSSPSTGLLLRSGYSSSAGHVDHADYRDGFASVSGNLFAGDQTFLPGSVSLSGKLGFSGRAYRFYGSANPDLQRSINRVQGSVQVGGDLEQFTYTTELSVNHASARDRATSSETEMGMHGTAEKDLGRVVVRGSADLWANSFSTAQDPYLAGMSLDARYDIAPRVQLSGGLGFFSSRGSEGEGDGRLYPLAGVAWRTTDQLTLSARFAPFLQRSTLSWVLQQNPYVDIRAGVRHPDYHTNLELAGDMEFTKGFSGRLAFKYQRADYLPVYIEQVAATGGTSGAWDIDYSGTTRIFGLDAEFSATLTPESYALVSLAWRDTRNSTTGNSLPYAPGFQAGATYRHTFPVGITLQTDINLYGSQFADPAGGQRLTGYTLLDFRAEYEIIPLFAVGAGVQNLLDQSFERWRRYAGIPRTAMLFGRYSW